MKIAGFAALVILFVAPAAFADIAIADLSLSATLSPADVHAGEFATVTVHAVNKGPETATGVRLTLFGSFLVTGIDAPGWITEIPTGVCDREALAVGTSDVSFRVLIDHAGAQSITATIGAASNDSHPEDNQKEIDLSPAAVGYVDVSVEDSHEPSIVPSKERLTLATKVSNRGPGALSQVFVFDQYFLSQAQSADPFSLESVAGGWSCQRVRRGVLCRSEGGLEEGASTTLRYTIVASAAGSIQRGTYVEVAGAVPTPPSRMMASEYIVVGSDAEFERILLPVTMTATAGAYGSMWATDLVAIAQGPDVLLFPTAYVCQVSQCPPQPPFGNFLPSGWAQVCYLSVLPPDPNPGRFVYTETSTSSLLTLNLRAHDSSRQLETWGTELPVVRQSQTISGQVELLDLPLDDRFRQTVRLYDFDARGDSQVSIRLFARADTGREVEIAQFPLTLTVPPDNNVVSPLQLAARPGYAQLDGLLERFPELAKYTTLRVEIEPLTPGLRYWAFASITNNETQHVTTITPQ